MLDSPGMNGIFDFQITLSKYLKNHDKYFGRLLKQEAFASVEPMGAHEAV